jgi:lysophospholipase L1-like esterase
MKTTNFMRSCALAAILGLTACSGGGGTPSPAVPPPSGNGVLAQIVGIGDSLTAGFQSGGLLGIPTTNPISILPGHLVPPTQENGWWALMYEQAKGVSAGFMANPATSVLPLINPPGLGSQLVPTAALFGATHSDCDAFNQAGYSRAGAASVRANPATNPLDLGMPGATVHEALFMIGPISPTCVPLQGNDPTIALQPIVSGESGVFYPILGTFVPSLGTQTTMVNSAVALRPTLTTVWLGANDLLKYTFSGAKAPVDTPQQMQADLVQIIQKLQSAGSRVVVANLPDVLSTPQFFQGGPTLQATLTAFLERPPFNLPPPVAAGVAAQITAYVAAVYGVGPNGYLTLSGLVKIFEALQTNPGNPQFNTLNDATCVGPGSTLDNPANTPPECDFLQDAYAARIQGLNNAFNGSIASAAQQAGAPLVDVHQLFVTIKANGGVPINPPICCNLQFGGGLLSLDGLHPSNTGYALLANTFIATIDGAFQLSVPPLTQAQILAIYATDPYAPH